MAHVAPTLVPAASGGPGSEGLSPWPGGPFSMASAELGREGAGVVLHDAGPGPGRMERRDTTQILQSLGQPLNGEGQQSRLGNPGCGAGWTQSTCAGDPTTVSHSRCLPGECSVPDGPSVPSHVHSPAPLSPRQPRGQRAVSTAPPPRFTDAERVSEGLSTLPQIPGPQGSRATGCGWNPGEPWPLRAVEHRLWSRPDPPSALAPPSAPSRLTSCPLLRNRPRGIPCQCPGAARGGHSSLSGQALGQGPSCPVQLLRPSVCLRVHVASPLCICVW